MPASAPAAPRTLPRFRNLEDRAPSRIPWPPLLYLLAAVLSMVLHIALPLPWFGEPLSDVLFAIGLLVTAAGVLLDLFAVQTLFRAGPTVMPNRPSAHLVTGGPFTVTRNPIYLGNTLILSGIGLAAGIAWFFAFALLAAAATQKLAVIPEEKHLEARFGESYRDYRRRVRRWL